MLIVGLIGITVVASLPSGVFEKYRAGRSATIDEE
jgi:hypothetical protein